MGGHGAHSLDLVRGDGDAEARSADEQGAVDGAVGDELGGGGGAVRVGGFVGAGVGADVGDGEDAGVGFEVGFDGVFVGYAGVLDGNQRCTDGRGEL